MASPIRVVHVVARLAAAGGANCTVIPGVGTVTQLAWAAFTSFPLTASDVPNSGAINNDRGQILFGATLADGQGVLLLATPD